jgi:hypothetical protein
MAHVLHPWFCVDANHGVLQHPWFCVDANHGVLHARLVVQFVARTRGWSGAGLLQAEDRKGLAMLP